MSGEHLDLSSDPEGSGEGARRQPGEARRFLGVHFTCCDIYSRVYVNRDETAYVGRCPGCARRITFQIGPGGTGARFFRAE
jgi:hypothetical protein